MKTNLSPAQIRMLWLIARMGYRYSKLPKRHRRIGTWKSLYKRGFIHVGMKHVVPKPWLPKPLGPLSVIELTAAGHHALQQALRQETAV